MHIPQIILALLAIATSVSALDAYFFTSSQCNNQDGGICRALQPNVCCGTSEFKGFQSIGYYGILTNWNIDIGGYILGCEKAPHQHQNVHGSTFSCIQKDFDRPAWFQWTRYHFVSKKRDPAVFENTCAAAPESPGCSEVRRFDAWQLGGTVYNLTSLSEEAHAEFVAHATNATSAADIPAALLARVSQ